VGGGSENSTFIKLTIPSSDHIRVYISRRMQAIGLGVYVLVANGTYVLFGLG